jgi:hypothetical protein
MQSNAPDRWEVEEDDFGRPLVRHKHPTGTVTAYVSRDSRGTTVARCTECQESYVLRGTRSDARPDQ